MSPTIFHFYWQNRVDLGPRANAAKGVETLGLVTLGSGGQIPHVDSNSMGQREIWCMQLMSLCLPQGQEVLIMVKIHSLTRK